MPTLNILLDNARKTRNLPSDMALADALKISRSAVSLWRKGGVIREEHLTALVELAKAEPATAIKVMSEQARTVQEKAVWGALARQLGVAATVAAVTLVGWFPTPAHAASVQAEQNAAICIMRSLARVARKLLGRWVWRSTDGTAALLA